MKTFIVISTLVFFIFPGPILYAQTSKKITEDNGADPFKEYIHSVPVDIKQLSEVHSVSGSLSITTRKFIYKSRKGANTIYGIMVYPQQQGKYPAILFLHGGGSAAEDLLPTLQDYAGKGNVAFAIDQPGICGLEKAMNSDGPWKYRAEGQLARYDMSGGAHTSTLADAGIAAIEGFNLLFTQPNVDATNIGITGFSWGGYSTTMLAGILGRKVKAAYSVFGCGYQDKGSVWMDIIHKMPEAERETWLKYLDAGRRMQHITAPYFLEATTNDTYFWPEAVDKSIRAARGTKNHVWMANLNHKQGPSGAAMQKMYFDYYLKGIGHPFCKVAIVKTRQRYDGDKKVIIRVSVPRGVSVDSVQLYYSEKGPRWPDRLWKPLVAQKKTKLKYTADIPVELANKNVDYYVHASDSRKVVVSGYMYQALETNSINKNQH